MGMHISEKRTL